VCCQRAYVCMWCIWCIVVVFVVVCVGGCCVDGVLHCIVSVVCGNMISVPCSD